MSRTFAYMRVSTREQSVDRQEHVLEQTGLNFDMKFHDKVSGKSFERPQYQVMIQNIKEGDLVVCTSLDRLGRNYNEIIEQWNIITKVKKAHIKICDMELLDTTKVGGTLTSQFISDLVLQILSYVAESERQKIQKRVKEGLDKAKAQGVTLGRPKLELPEDFEDVYKEYRRKLITSKEAMEKLEMKRSSFFKVVKEYEMEKGIIG